MRNAGYNITFTDVAQTAVNRSSPKTAVNEYTAHQRDTALATVGLLKLRRPTDFILKA